MKVPEVYCHYLSHAHSCFKIPLSRQHGILPYHCLCI